MHRTIHNNPRKDKAMADYITIGGSSGAEAIKVWWEERDNAMHLGTSDPRFTSAPEEGGEDGGPGLRWKFSANPRSADYNPRYFNRVARALRAAGKRAPEHDVPEHKRRLDQRSDA
jgi:hypothetical protein